MQIFNRTIPAPWLGVLDVIRSVFPEAILAGGCLRDLVLGGEVNDLDVFVQHNAGWEVSEDGRYESWPSSQSRMDALADVAGWVRHTLLHGYGNLAEVTTTRSYSVPGLGHAVNVTHLDMPSWSTRGVLDRMDFGACQIGIDHLGEYITPQAGEDLERRRITLLRIDNPADVSRSLRRAVRFGNKYAGTDVVVDISTAAHLFADINDVRAK